MRQIYYAGKSGDWETHLEEFLGNGKLSVWASVKVRECFSVVEQEDEGRESIAQDILREHGPLEADHRTSGRTGSGPLVVCVPSLSQIRV